MIPVRSRPVRFVAALALAIALVGALPAAPLRISDDSVRPPSLHPWEVFAWKPDALLGHIFDGLLGFDPEGNLVPRLATSWTWLGPTRLRLELRRNVRFHDGTPFDSEVAAWNFETLRSMLPHHPRAAFFAGIRAVTREGSHGLVLELERPDGTLLHRLAAFSWMVPASDREPRQPVGTGPYRFAGWQPDGSLRLAAVPDHWAGGPAFPDGLEWWFLPEEVRVSRLLSGDLDLLGEVSPYYHRRIQESPRARLVKAETLVQMNLLFDTRAGPAADPRVRQAIAYALKVDDLIRFIARGNARAVTGTTMPSQVGHVELAETPEFDPGHARRLLAEAAPSGPLGLSGMVDPELLLLGEAVASQLSKVGIRVRFEPGSREAFRNEVAARRDPAIAAPRHDVYLFATPDPTYHCFFINGLALTGGSPWNLWQSPAYDLAYDSMLRADRAGPREESVRTMEQLVVSERPALTLYQAFKGYGVASGVELRPTRSGMLDLRWSRPVPVGRPELAALGSGGP